MSNDILIYFIGGVFGLLVIMILAFLIINKKLNTDEAKKLRSLREGTKKSNFSAEIIFQKLYIIYIKIPIIRRYLLKVRRRLEIINVEDEYRTRSQSSKILTRALIIITILTILIVAITHNNMLLLCTLILFEIFMIESMVESSVNKIDNKILSQQVELFAEIRHAYHEFNMVEEAIYQVAQDDEKEVSRQAEKIYEILISDDPESELEKYYDVAPNAYLKEFAGVSYLTKEFGDRKIDKGSLYLKNLNNITQEMQLEILKRDKIDYLFQSLSLITAAPILILEPLKSWAVSNFGFTSSFYNGKLGLITQVVIIIMIFMCYMLIRKVKDISSTSAKNTENPLQAKIYKIPFVKQIIDLFIPKKGTKEYIKTTKLLKDSASTLKMEWLFVNKVLAAVLTAIISIILIGQLHKVAIDYVYTEPTSENNVMGMSESDTKKAMELTKQDNKILNKYKNQNLTQEELENKLKYEPDYEDLTEEKIKVTAERIFKKLNIVNEEKLQWLEVLVTVVLTLIAYSAPTLIIKFQIKMRQLEMEDEVMQFQTIILMLMKIERVNVEIILEWLERYANIFKDPITKCVNNYEAGPWEALQELKQEVEYPDFVRLVEGMQSAVEKIPINDAFDELDTERDYYKEKRKESNERLIKKKSAIGRFIGFAPLVVAFVGYLIVPLVVIGMTSMTGTFSGMTTTY